MKPEQHIVDGIKTGDSQVLKLVYIDYFGMVKNFVVKNSGSISDAEDIFQDALVALFRKFNDTDFHLHVQFKTYLYSVCRNLWLTELQRRGVRTRRVKDYEVYVETGLLFATNWKEKQEETIIRIEKAMKYLGEKCQQILLMFYYQKRTMTEIAQVLDYTNADTVKTQKYKCIRQLKRNLNP